MKKYLLLIMVSVLVKSSVTACDICGTYMGIIPNEKNSYIAIFNRYRAFKGETFTGSNAWFPDGAYFKTEHAGHNASGLSMYEVFRVNEVRARYFVHPRVELNMVLPYIAIKEVVGSAVSEAKGLGDISFIVGYHLLDNKSTGNLRHRLVVGAGIKVSSGDDRNDAFGQRIPIMNQPGTGANDAILSLTYLVGYNNWGVMLNAMGKMNGTNAFREKIGNSINLSTGLFYKIKTNFGLHILPCMNLSYEHTKGVYLNNVLQRKSEMKSLIAAVGMQMQYRKFGLDVSVGLPVDEPKSSNTMFTTTQMVVGLTYNFSQKNYLFSNGNGETK